MSPHPLLIVRCIRRPETNVYSTLACMAAADPQRFAEAKVVLISGDGDVKFLEHLTYLRHMHVVTPPGIGSIASWTPKRKALWSYTEALRIAADRGSHCVVMEDDIAFCNGWLGRLMQRVEHVQSSAGSEFILSAYHRELLQDGGGGVRLRPTQSRSSSSQERHRCLGKNRSPNSSSHSTQRPVPFYGNLCTYWPAKHISDFVAYARETIRANALPLATDLTVDRFCTTRSISIYYTVPSLVQHVGDTTTLIDNGIRRSPMYATFAEDAACPSRRQ